MATLSIQSGNNEQGVSLTMSNAAGGGDQFLNTGRERLIVHNGDASAKTVTITAQSTSATLSGYGTVTKADTALSVAAGAVAVIGPFPKPAFNDVSGYAQITYSATTSVKVAVVL